MTGHMYKKVKRTTSTGGGAGGGDDDGGVEADGRLNEGDANSGSVTSAESDRSSSKYVRVSRGAVRALTVQFIDGLLSSVKFNIGILCLVGVNSACVVASLMMTGGAGTDRATTALLLLFRYVSVATLVLFVVEMAVKAAVWRRRLYTDRMELFDCVVILVTLALTLAFDDVGGEDGNGVCNSFALIVLLRLWRVTKIFNGMVASARTESERRVKKEQRRSRALEREVVKLREYCMQQECELQMYRVMLQQNNIPQPTVIRVPAVPRTLNVIAEVNNEHDDGGGTEEPSAAVTNASVNATTCGPADDHQDIDAPPPDYSEYCDYATRSSPPYTQHSAVAGGIASCSPPPPLTDLDADDEPPSAAGEHV